jgi:hypothetical protein
MDRAVGFLKTPRTVHPRARVSEAQKLAGQISIGLYENESEEIQNAKSDERLGSAGHGACDRGHHG